MATTDNIDNLDKVDNVEFYGFMIAKAGLNLIPNVGGSLASLLGDIQSIRNEKRLRAFITQWSNDLATRIDKIQQDYVSREDFIDVFLNITEDSMKQRQEEKRTCLKNLLVNSITTPNTSYDLTEELQRLIDLLSVIHVKILKVFYEDKEHPRHEPKVDVDRIMKAINTVVVGESSNNSNGSDNNNNSRKDRDIVALIRDLENQGLVESFLNNMYSRLSGASLVSKEPYITSKGRALIEYVTL